MNSPTRHMQDSERHRLEQLVAWRPKDGVISIFFEIDPGDRSGAWRVELKDGLSALSEPGDHDGKLAVRETVDRVLERFDSEDPPPGRAHAGFIEVARKQGAEDWSSFQISSRDTVVRHGPRPLLRPLIDLINRGRAHPVLAISAERVRGWLWDRGQLEPEPAWGAELAIYPGHELKAPAMTDPARGHGTSSSGHDQFEHRLEDNRKRFLEDFARGLNEDRRVRGTEVIAIGEAHYLDEFVAGLPSTVEAWKVEGADVINDGEAAVAERVSAEVERSLNETEADLVSTVVDTAMTHGGRGAVGVNETSEALVEGRVEHLVLSFDGEISLGDLSPAARESIGDGERLDAAELMIELALRTSADVTPVTGDAGEALREHGGAAALLRY